MCGTIGEECGMELNGKKEKASSRRDNLQKTYSTNIGIDNAQNEKKKDQSSKKKPIFKKKN